MSRQRKHRPLRLVLLTAGLLLGVLAMHVTTGASHDGHQMPASTIMPTLVSTVMAHSLHAGSSQAAADPRLDSPSVAISPGRSDSPGAAVLAACTLSAPSPDEALVRGGASLVAVLALAWVVGAAGGTTSDGRRRSCRMARGLPRHTLCVIRA